MLALSIIVSLAACSTPSSDESVETADGNGSDEATVTQTDATAAPDSQGGIVRGGTLVVAKSADLTTGGFDVVHSSSYPADGMILSQIFESLLDVDESGNIIPRLATEWEYTEDGCGLILKLREDVVYSNGEKFNAEAVAKVVSYYIDPETEHKAMKWDLALITGIDVIDEYTVQINTSSPDAGLLLGLTYQAFAMIAPSNIDNDDLLTNPIGTGPFKLEEYVDGSHVTLVANEKLLRLR